MQTARPFAYPFLLPMLLAAVFIAAFGPTSSLAAHAAPLRRGEGIVLASSQVAPAARLRAAVATCSGTDCDQKNPYATGCAGGRASYRVLAVAYLIDPTTGYTFGHAQLWFSDTCQTNWARYVCDQPPSSCPQLSYTLESADGRQESNYGIGGVTFQLYLPRTKAGATAFLAGIPAFATETGWY